MSSSKVVGHGKPMGAKRTINIGMLARVMKMLYRAYPVLIPITAFCIIFSAVVSAIPAIFIQKILEVHEMKLHIY